MSLFLSDQQSKSRVVPLTPIAIPPLELSAAVVSVKISSMLKQKLNFSDAEERYRTDSKIVLGYTANDSRRFHVFVGNRLQLTHDHKAQSHWRYIDTKENPAKIASRGVLANEILKNFKWFNGPSFLLKSNCLFLMKKSQRYLQKIVNSRNIRVQHSS